MGAALIIPLITAALPVAKEIFDSIFAGIAEVNKSKLDGVKLTADQATAANANATQIAQISLKSKVDSGKLTQDQVNAILPSAQDISKMVQAAYAAGAALPGGIVTSNITPLQQAALQVIFGAK